MALYFCTVSSNGDGFSLFPPTLVAPVAVFFFCFLASREFNDAVLFGFLRFAPPLNSKMDWMLVMLSEVRAGFFSPNAVGIEFLLLWI